MTDITLEKSGGSAVITLNRPHVLNALRPESLREVEAALDDVEVDYSIRVLLITGSGRAFCAGEDLRELSGRLSSTQPALSAVDVEPYQHLTRRLRALPQVSVAAINGVAVGLGAEIAVACDIRIASESARIGFVESKRALFETNGVTYLLPRLIGLGPAMDLMISGEIISATDAHRLGLITRVYPEGAFSREALGFAGAIADNAPLTVRALKRILLSRDDTEVEHAMKAEVEAVLACAASEDAREGAAAFLEGRAPRYRGT